MTVSDDFATLRRALDAKPTNPTRLRWNAYSALDRVEAEITRLKQEKGDLRAAYLAVSAKNAAAEAEAARLRDEIQREYVLESTHHAITGRLHRENERLRDGLREAKWLIGAGLPHTMEWHDRADAWHTAARALLAEDGAACGHEVWKNGVCELCGAKVDK